MISSRDDYLKYFSLILMINFILIAVFYCNQLPVDDHPFRQSQTAISIYWMIEDGFKLNYETPVVGKPWSIPFEFPIYQFIAAALTEISGISVNASGRLLSALSLIISIVASRYIIKEIIPEEINTFYKFCIIILSSPIYIYWGRSIMIETICILFVIVSFYMFVMHYKYRYKIYVFLFSVFSALAYLQKITTALPFYGILAVCFLCLEYNRTKFRSINNVSRFFLDSLFGFLIPALIGYLWVIYSDIVKSGNVVGQQLVSSKLSTWNWGTLHQKFSLETYSLVVWERVLISNLGGLLLVVSLIFVPFYIKIDRYRILLIFIAILAFLLPIFLFTNLHFVHSYYQTANAFFAMFALAVLLGSCRAKSNGRYFSNIVITLIAASNLWHFHAQYWNIVRKDSYASSRDAWVGQALGHHLPQDGQFIGFGNDWSAAIPYIAERKAFMVPDWLPDRRGILAEPDRYLDAGRLSAVSSCGPTGLPDEQLIDFAASKGWALGKTADCLIAFKPKVLDTAQADETKCVGNLDSVLIDKKGNTDILNIKGWVTADQQPVRLPDEVYVKISSDASIRYVETLRVQAPTVNKYLGVNHAELAGYSALIPLENGDKDIHIDMLLKDKTSFRLCRLDKSISR